MSEQYGPPPGYGSRPSTSSAQPNNGIGVGGFVCGLAVAGLVLGLISLVPPVIVISALATS